MELDTFAARCTRRANAALAPVRCDVRVVSRPPRPLVLEIVSLPGQTLTPAQRDVALTAALAENPAARTPRPLGGLVADIESWIGTDAGRLRHVAASGFAVALLQRPRLARPLGIPLDGDA